MALTEKQIYDLNNMNVAAQNVELGTILSNSGTGYVLPEATSTVIGGVKQSATQADSTATDVEGLVTDFNALLAKLKTAGIME